MKKVIKIIVDSTFIILLVAAALLVILRAFGIKAYAVKTASMSPACPIGTMIFVESSSIDQLNEGDIIVFKKGTLFVTHRIYSISDNKVKTKGDNNNTPDSFELSEDEIVGKVLVYFYYIGYVYIFGETIYGKITIVATFVFLALISSYLDKNEQREDETDLHSYRGDCFEENKK